LPFAAAAEDCFIDAGAGFAASVPPMLPVVLTGFGLGRGTGVRVATRRRGFAR
jgi:hypothetical protein